MVATLWIALGVVAGIATLACLYAPLLKRSLVGYRSRPPAPPPGWRPRLRTDLYLPPRFAPRQNGPLNGRREVRGLTKSEAEDLLDWLEAHEVSRREVAYTDADGFVVTYS